MLITSLQSFVLTAAMVLVTGVAAAEAALKSVHDDWQVRCDTLPDAQGEQCALTQSDGYFHYLPKPRGGYRLSNKSEGIWRGL
jgi:hypothetical protein